MLCEYIKLVRDIPFQWGIHDCSLFVADCVQVMTGNDYSQYFNHTNKKEALKYIAKHGGLSGICDRFLDRKNINYLQRGDVVLIDAGYEILGLYMGELSAILEKDGLKYCSNQNIKRGWSVGLASC